MNRFHRVIPAELKTSSRTTDYRPGRPSVRLGAQEDWALSPPSVASLQRSFPATLVAAALLTSSLVMMSPAMAQLRGDWPTDVHLTRVSDSGPTRADHFNLRSNDNRVDVPRGDLRKDVADAARTDPRRPMR